jgi:hypothetical protein
MPAENNADSPEELGPHPGARETDPFFSTARGVSQDEVEEVSNPSGRFQDTSPAASTACLADSGSAHSAHNLQALGFKPGVIAASRRNSSQSALGLKRKKPTRTESGREFWGLPEAPRGQRSMLSHHEEPEDSSEDEEAGEWVSMRV